MLNIWWYVGIGILSLNFNVITLHRISYGGLPPRLIYLAVYSEIFAGSFQRVAIGRNWTHTRTISYHLVPSRTMDKLIANLSNSRWGYRQHSSRWRVRVGRHEAQRSSPCRNEVRCHRVHCHCSCCVRPLSRWLATHLGSDICAKCWCRYCGIELQQIVDFSLIKRCGARLSNFRKNSNSLPVWIWFLLLHKNVDLQIQMLWSLAQGLRMLVRWRRRNSAVLSCTQKDACS